MGSHFAFCSKPQEREQMFQAWDYGLWRCLFLWFRWREGYYGKSSACRGIGGSSSTSRLQALFHAELCSIHRLMQQSQVFTGVSVSDGVCCVLSSQISMVPPVDSQVGGVHYVLEQWLTGRQTKRWQGSVCSCNVLLRRPVLGVWCVNCERDFLDVAQCTSGYNTSDVSTAQPAAVTAGSSPDWDDLCCMSSFPCLSSLSF